MKNNFEGIISKTVMKDFQALAEALSPVERTWKIIVDPKSFSTDPDPRIRPTALLISIRNAVCIQCWAFVNC